MREVKINLILDTNIFYEIEATYKESIYLIAVLGYLFDL